MPSELAICLRAARARAYVRIVGANREPSWWITEVALPLIAMSAYVFVYRSIGAPRVYEGMVIIGGTMVPFWLTVLWAMAAQFYWEKEMGNLELYMAAPASAMALLLGMAVGGVFMAGCRAAAVLVLGFFFFGVTFSVSSWPLLALVFALTLGALYSLGMAASSLYYLVGRAGIKINLLAMEPVYLLSGFYFPVKQLGRTLATLGCLIPLTLGLDAVRQIALPGARSLGFLSVSVEAALLGGMTIIFFFAAVAFMRAMERRGKKRGTLTLKWQ